LTIVDLPIPDGPVITTNDLFLTSSKMVVTAEVSKNLEFRVLGTCRLQISASSPFRKLQEKFGMTKCDLLHENFLYSKEEKLKIAACYIDKETIKQYELIID
jgi:hypothetical protein